MRKMIKVGLGMCFCVFCAFAVVATICGSNQKCNDDLWTENVEALTESEFMTKTTWSCSGMPITASCSITCGVCGTSTNGNGTLRGYHECNVKKP